MSKRQHKLSRSHALETLVAKHRKQYKEGAATDPTLAPKDYSPAYLNEWRRQCDAERAVLFTK
jgi:hypothetical protein